MHLGQLKGMQCSDLKALYIKGVPFVNRTYTTGLLFLSKMEYKMVRGWGKAVCEKRRLQTCRLAGKRDKHSCEML